MTDPLKIGISTCLLGEPVRFDGGHKLDRYLVNTLGRYFEYVPVCPETEAGFGVPRESMRLVAVDDPDNPRLWTNRSKRDCTDQMVAWAHPRLDQLARENLYGYIFKSKSPSSGAFRVKVYDTRGNPCRTGAGIFARLFMQRFPLLPVEEEGRLHDPKLREMFIENVFTLQRWREAADRRSAGALVAFHARHKLLLMSHSPAHLKRMGALVAQVKAHPLPEVLDAYQVLLLEAIRLKTTPRKNTNVLQHMMGYFKKQLSGDEKKELLELVHNYHAGLLPLVVPLTLLNHYVRKYDQAYLREQWYLQPHPVELALRNHA